NRARRIGLRRRYARASAQSGSAANRKKSGDRIGCGGGRCGGAGKQPDRRSPRVGAVQKSHRRDAGQKGGDEGLRTSPHPSLSLRARVGKKRRRNPDRLKEAKSPALCTTTEFSSELGLSDHSYSLARLRERARVRGSPMSIKVFASCFALCSWLLAFRPR